MMPAGRYYIGDLCYVMHPEWDEFCKITTSWYGCLEGEFTLADGRRFATYGTAWGDGEYCDENGRKYSVDAGLIGCILVDDIRDDSHTDLEHLGNIVEFNTPFYTGNQDGVIQFGSVLIDTDPMYEQELEEH